MPKQITINKEKIGLGEQKTVNLNIARLPTYTSIDLPVLVYRAPEDGPVLLLTGGLHGDEINGVETIRRMIERELVLPDKGTVIAIPIVNIYGFIQNSRGLPDGKDINRSFPGARGRVTCQVNGPYIDVGDHSCCRIWYRFSYGWCLKV
ncbi:MAG: succinylglutamate desuccinylase/aspartoacylase family protein [Gracilimonas sp.]|nr:succinylglutamate desuccinylase/aspartoacylase family protein [Gracilimonas sp.]